MKSYDVLIIGAGQAGIPLARQLAQCGKRVAIVERKHLGGSCVNFGCTPSKAVIASARVAHQARRASEYGVGVGEVKIDFAKVIERARSFVEASKKSLAKGLAKAGAEVLNGHARFADRDAADFRLVIEGETVAARQVVINTGTRSMVPSIDGIDAVPFLHAGNWLNQTALPQHLIFIGAGIITLELAQFYRRMGSAVTVIGHAAQVAEQEDEDIATLLQKQLEGEGVRFVLHAAVQRVGRAEGGVECHFEREGQSQTVRGSHLFIATGRKANTDDLGLDTVGVKVDEHGIVQVDPRLATTTPGIWAAGDVRGGPMFTHTAWDDHRILESQLLSDGSQTTASRVVPYAIFTDPELGRVGLTEKAARQRHGDAVSVTTFDMRHNGKAAELGESAGMIKLVTDRRNNKLLGAAVLGHDGAELVATYITLMNADAPLSVIRNAIYIHPTLAEAVQSAALAVT